MGKVPSRPQSKNIELLKQVPSTIAITGSNKLSSEKSVDIIKKAVQPYLGTHTIWYCGSFGGTDEIALDCLLEENQQVIVVGYNEFRISDHIRSLLETHQLPFVNSQQEEVPDIPSNISKRDILFFTKSDLVIVIWNGRSQYMQFFLRWLREQRKNHVVVFA